MGGYERYYEGTCGLPTEIERLCRESNEARAAVTRCKTAIGNAEFRLKVAQKKINEYNERENQRVAQDRCDCPPRCKVCGKVQ